MERSFRGSKAKHGLSSRVLLACHEAPQNFLAPPVLPHHVPALAWPSLTKSLPRLSCQQICIYLKSKYSLDGRDPNGYVGVLWSMVGIHDMVGTMGRDAG